MINYQESNVFSITSQKWFKLTCKYECQANDSSCLDYRDRYLGRWLYWIQSCQAVLGITYYCHLVIRKANWSFKQRGLGLRFRKNKPRGKVHIVYLFLVVRKQTLPQRIKSSHTMECTTKSHLDISLSN